MTSGRRNGRRGYKMFIAPLAIFVAGVTAVSCLDFESTSPNQLAYLTFERLPFPAVVLGDTLRDSTGAVVALEARAVNGSGDPLADAVIQYFAIDDSLGTLDLDIAGARVISTGNGTGTIKVVASVGTVQSPPLTLTVTLRPDSLALAQTSDTIEYSFTDTTRNFSAALAAQVLHHDSATFYSGVGSWVIRYSLESLADTANASLVDDQNRRLRNMANGSYHVDTTGGDGTGSRKLRIVPGPPLSGSLDSVAVIVEARYRGEHIAGSPARIVVYTRPRITP